MPEIDIGIGKSARLGYTLDEIAIVPSRRTRDPEDVDVSWQLDAFRFDIPIMAAAMDAVVSPSTAATIADLGGLAVLNLEGLWCRYDDPSGLFDEIVDLDPDHAIARLQEIYRAPIRPELVVDRIREIGETGAVTAGALTPQRVPSLAESILEAELDVLVIQGTVVSAEHVSKGDEPLNLKRFIRELDIPVVVGGCSSYQAALHLMRTGAVGILVGVGTGAASTTSSVLGIGAPLATAIADAAGARSQHLEETGVYVQVIADGGLRGGGDIAKAIACGADAVMVGSLLAGAGEAPGHGVVWGGGSPHATLPRGQFRSVVARGDLREVLFGPAHDETGATNLVGALRSAMAMCGYASIREFHKADVVVSAAR